MQLKPIVASAVTAFWFAFAISANLSMLGSAAKAGELSARQNEIMRITLASDGWLTEDMHREFWAQIPVSDRSNPVMKMFLEQVLSEGLDFQRGTWKSVMFSLQAGQVTKSPDYESAKARILSSSTSVLLQEQNATAIKNAESLMDAAANKSVFVTPRGKVYITYELVSKTISGLESSLCRARQLANPNWNPKVEETKYSDAHVRILSDCPFRIEYQDVSAETGKKTRITMLLYAASPTNRLAVEFISTGAQFAVPQESIEHMALSALTGMGIVGVNPINSQWRGRASSEASGSFASSQGTIYASVRAVSAPEYQGVWAFLAVTPGSKVEAQIQRNSLEASTQLDTR